jgi:hypothetical protein
MVLVVNVEIVEGENIAVPSLVTFHTVKHEFNDGRGFWYFSAFRECGFKFLASALRINREFSMPGRTLGTEGMNSSTPNNIKSASEIVDRITNNQGNVMAQLSISKAVIEELFPRFAVDVQAGAVTVRRGAESLLDIRDVLIGPFDF